MAGTINTQAQLQVSSSATYTTNAANLITAALVRTLNENWISSSVVIPMTASMTVLSSSYAATASVLIGTVVSASYAFTASSAISSSFAETASFVLNATPAFPFTGSAAITGSLTITGSIRQFVENTGSKTTNITAVTNSFVGNTQITGSGNGNNALRVSGSGNFAGSLSVSRNLTLGSQSAVNTSTISVDSTTKSSMQLVTYGTTNVTSSFIMVATDNSAETGSSLQIDSTLQNLKFYDYDNTTTDKSVFLTINSYDTATKSIPTFNRGLNVTGSFIVTGSAQSNVVSQSVASSTASIDSRAGNSWFIQLPATSTTFFNFTNLLEGQTGNIIVSGSSAGTASFSSNVKQVSGSAYNNSTVGGIDVLSFSTWNNNVYLVNSKKFV